MAPQPEEPRNYADRFKDLAFASALGLVTLVATVRVGTIVMDEVNAIGWNSLLHHSQSNSGQ